MGDWVNYLEQATGRTLTPWQRWVARGLGHGRIHTVKWKWLVRCYYADTVEYPKVPGGLAIETCHVSDHSRDAEVAAGWARKDIGRVEFIAYDARRVGGR